VKDLMQLKESPSGGFFCFRVTFRVTFGETRAASDLTVAPYKLRPHLPTYTLAWLRDTRVAPCGLFIFVYTYYTYACTPPLDTTVGMIPTLIPLTTVGMACGLLHQSTGLFNSLPRSNTVSESRRIKPRTFGNTGNIDPISTPIAWLGVCLKAGMRGQATIKAFNIKATGNGD
jgi:hypothetical protein